MSNESTRVLQISDVHMFGNSDQILLGVNTYHSFHSIIDSIKKCTKLPELIILSGDLSQDGSVEAYKIVADLLSELEIPVYWIPGNHDNRENLNKVYPYCYFAVDKQVIINDWQFILLDSLKESEVAGFLASDQLTFLQKCLKEYPQHSAIVVLHHHPVPIGCAWLNKISLKNSNDFWNIITKFPQVHTVLFGHVHQEFETLHNNVQCYAAPSTWIQFKPNHETFALDYLPQGYRWIDLYPNKKMQTGIIRLSAYSGVFDENARSY